MQALRYIELIANEIMEQTAYERYEIECQRTYVECANFDTLWGGDGNNCLAIMFAGYVWTIRFYGDARTDKSIRYDIAVPFIIRQFPEYIAEKEFQGFVKSLCLNSKTYREVGLRFRISGEAFNIWRFINKFGASDVVEMFFKKLKSELPEIALTLYEHS